MIRTALTLVAAGGLLACATAGDELDGSDPDVPTTFEEFAAQTYRWVYDKDGNLIGINTLASDKRLAEGINFAIASGRPVARSAGASK